MEKSASAMLIRRMTSISAMMLNSAAALTEQTVAWSTTDKQSNIALSNGNRDAGVSSSFSFPAVRADRGNNAGKRYFEISMPTVPGSARHGFGNGSFSLATYVGNSATSIGIANVSQTNSGYTIVNGVSPGAESASDYYMFAIDFATGKAWVGKNGTWYNSGNPAAGTNEWISGVTGAVYPATSGYTNGSARIHGNSSNFNTSPPSGFSAWGA